MKTSILLLFALQLSLIPFSEKVSTQVSPEGIVYQAEARDNKGGVIKKSDLTIQASILADNPTGSLVWKSEYQVVTDDYGFFTLILGQGNVLVGNFSTIAWGSTAHFLNISVFYKKEWTDMGTTQLLSVPYAFHSKTSTTALNFTETDPVFTVHPSFGITPSNIINWNQAFSWGNHAGLYRPLSYVPTWGEITMKPVFSPVATTGSYNDLTDKPTGTTIGEMTFWNGTQWTMIPVGRPGQYLQLNNFNIPEWSGPAFAVIATSAVSNITSTTAKSGGNVTNDGGGVITVRGVCWSTSENPTTLNNLTMDGAGSGEFTSNLTALTPNQLYFVRAYATSSAGTSYGNQISFTTNEVGAGSFTDTRDGNVYPLVQIGTQVWMAKNLAYLPSVNHPGDGSYEQKRYYVYGYPGTLVSEAKNHENYPIYGVLYNWEAANTACPTGWHLPTDEEWTVLTNYLTDNGFGYEGSGTDIGKSVASITKWTTSSTSGNVGNDQQSNNSSGFNAFPGGLWYNGFFYLGSQAYFWSSTKYGSPQAWSRTLVNYLGDFLPNYASQLKNGQSVRCLHD